MMIKHLARKGLLEATALSVHRCSYGTKVIRDVLKLYERGVFSGLSPEMSEPYVSRVLSTPQTIYCGFDPTADSLHVGNLLAIIGLIHCQRAGHSPIALVGGATAHIGDPSGKTSDRPKMDAETIENNIIRITENLERIFLNHELYLWKDSSQLKSLKVLNNMEWYKDKNIIQFLSDVGRHFRMGDMLSKHSVKSRIASADGMCFTEFTYQIFQANDWLNLYKQFDCKLQIGGNDQLGNITAGIELIRRVMKKDVYGLTLPLLTNSSGQKFGKSENNALWLDPNKTSPYALYQHFINTSDSDGERNLKMFTFIPDKDIAEIVRNQKEEPEKRTSQKLLADKLVTLVHGEDGLAQAKKWTKAFFGQERELLTSLSMEEMEKIFSSTSSVELLYDNQMTVCDLAMKIKSKSYRNQVEATHVIQNGGFYINHQKITEPDFVLVPGHHILSNNLTLIRVGKKTYHLVKWVYR